MQTQNNTLHKAFRQAGIPLWVTPCEAHGILTSRHFSESVADELADWIARRMSMCFAAGYLGHEALPMSAEDVQRQLAKMGYCKLNALEITGLMSELHPLLYSKGRDRGMRSNH